MTLMKVCGRACGMRKSPFRMLSGLRKSLRGMTEEALLRCGKAFPAIPNGLFRKAREACEDCLYVVMG
jgi:hypothetical protein